MSEEVNINFYNVLREFYKFYVTEHQMRIRMVRLQNIKSYIDETIYFNDGVNFISGVNGAGKTTIIESIGYALFDSKPGINSEFIRYGQKTGTITVEFEANDNRNYRVIRKIGGVNSWLVFDVETVSELDLHNASDVKPWLKDVFGLHQDQDLTQLFEDIIGVGQGMFTAPFLERPAERKMKFNKMLKVEAYREAGDRIHKVLKQLDESVSKNREARAEKEGSIKDYDGLSEEKSKLLVLTKKLDKELEQKKTILVDKLKKRDELRKLGKETDQVTKDIQLGETRLASHRDSVEKLNLGLAAAKEASRQVESSKPGYDKYVIAVKDREMLEQQRSKRDGLLGRCSEFKQKEAEIRTHITAGKEAADEEEKSLSEEAERIALRKAEVTDNRVLEQKLLEQIEKNLSEIDSYTGVIENFSKGINEADRIKARIVMVLEQWRAESEKIEAFKHYLSQEQIIKSKLDKLTAVEKEIGALKGEINVLEEKVKVLKENREKTSEGRCPFLDAECKNIEGSLASYFDKQLDECTRALTANQEILQQLEKQVQAKEELNKAYIKLENDKTSLEESERVVKRCLLEIGNQLKFLDEIFGSKEGSNFEQGEELGSSLDGMFRLLDNEGPDKGLEMSFDSLRDGCLEGLDSFNASVQLLNLFIMDFSSNRASHTLDMTDKISVLVEKGGELIEKLKKIQSEIRRRIEAKVSEHRTRLAGYNRELELLVRSEKDLKLKNTKLQERIQAIQQKASELLQVVAEKNELESKLSEYKNLEEMFKIAQQSIESCQQAYDTFIKYQVEAKKVTELETELSEKLLLIEREGAALEINKKRIEELSFLFSSDLLQASEQEVEALNLEIAAKEGTLAERLNDVQEYTKRLNAMDKTKREIEALTNEIDKLGQTRSMLEYIRSVLNRAGERVSAVYREYLAKEANRLYREISKENVTVEWQNDYEVMLLDMLNGKQRQRCFRQLSGGEQMTAALALRLSFLKQLSKTGIGFFDEPTTNLDGERRSNLVQIIPQVTGSFDQLFVISHDDSFDAMTENTVQLKKDSGEGTKLA